LRKIGTKVRLPDARPASKRFASKLPQILASAEAAGNPLLRIAQ
jgi:hypothetical protein